MRCVLSILSVVFLFTGAPAVAADDLTPLQDPPLAMPTPIPSTPAIPPPGIVAGPIGFYRPNRMDIWQYYGADRHGRFVPRVLLTGDGAFYYANGMPYPVSVNQMNVMPYLFD
jgi:hypothetical protein